MLGIKICRLADAVGLTQAAIAEHLGVDRAQVNRWAKGVRPVPEYVRTALIMYVLSAVRRCVDDIDAKRVELGPLGQVMNLDLRRRLIEVTAECLSEDMEAAREGPTAAIYDGLEALDHLKNMEPVDLLKPINAEQLLRLAEMLRVHAAVLCRLSPMFDVLQKEKKDANDRSQFRQSGAAGGAEPSAQ